MYAVCVRSMVHVNLQWDLLNNLLLRVFIYLSIVLSGHLRD